MLEHRWRISFFLGLLLLFILPHDPSTSLDGFGGEAFQLPAACGLSRHGTPHSLLRHSAPAAVAHTTLLDKAHAHLRLQRRASTASNARLARLMRLAQKRPQLVLRVLRLSLHNSRHDAGQIEGESLQSVLDVNHTGLHSVSVDALREGLRAQYGEPTWFGDLTPAETRALYHALLPTSLLDEHALSLPERAELAIKARSAARLYARERAMLPFSIGSQAFDGMRQLLQGGSFQADGLSEEQIWLKYGARRSPLFLFPTAPVAHFFILPLAAGSLPSDLPDGAAFHEEVYLTILRKACSTNRDIDKLCGAGYVDVNEYFDKATEAAEAAAQVSQYF